MTTANTGNLMVNAPDSQTSNEINNDKQCTTASQRTESCDDVTKSEFVKVTDTMSSNEISGEGVNLVNGEVEMSDIQTGTNKSEVPSELGKSHITDAVSSKLTDQSVDYVNIEQQFSSDPAKQSSSSSVQGDVDHDESSMDVDDFSTSSNPLLRPVMFDGSETTDSRDSFGVSGPLEIESAMDIDVVTSSSQDNHSKVIEKEILHV